MRYGNPSLEPVDHGLPGVDVQTALRLVRIKHFEATPERVDYGQRHLYWRVRLAWAKRDDYRPTDEQVRVGIFDKHHDVRLAWVKRRDWKVGCLTQDERDLLAADKSTEVVAAWIRRPDVRLAAPFLGDWKNAVHWRVRLAVALRQDWFASVDDIRRGLSDPSEVVRAAWRSRPASAYPGMPLERYRMLTA